MANSKAMAMAIAAFLAIFLLISTQNAAAALPYEQESLGRKVLEAKYEPNGRSGYNSYEPNGRSGYNSYEPNGRGGYNGYKPTGRGGYN